MRIALTAIACGLLVAACGSSGKQPSASGSQANRGLQLSQCMRSHGVPDFPDPNAQGDIAVTPGEVKSPAFQSAQQACRRFAPNKGNPPHMTASQYRAAVQFSECMRTHGAPDFPDPTTTPPQNGPVLVLKGMMFAPGPGFDPGSPAFRQAAQRCGIKLPTGPPPKAGG